MCKNIKDNELLSDSLGAGRLIVTSILVFFTPLTIGDVASGELTAGTAFDNGGTFQIISAPPVISDNFFDDNNVRAFNEVQDFTLADRLVTDVAPQDLGSNVVGAGSVISSHYVLFDPDGFASVTGSVTFDAPVVGIVTLNTSFDATDALLGNPATDYAIGGQQLEIPPDILSISGNTVNFELTAGSPGDAMRVITSNNLVPGINVCEAGTETLSGEITGGLAQQEGSQFRQICAPIGEVGDDNFNSINVYAFEEQQGVELTEDLFIDQVNFIPAGEFVSSFYVVFDPAISRQVEATVTFPDTVIDVISDRDQLIASEFLGNASAIYLNPTLLGLEPIDTFTIAGNQVSIDFTASSPGDSIRVILGSASPSLNYNVCDAMDVTITGEIIAGDVFDLGGSVLQLCDPIGPVGNNNFQANDLFVFAEQQNVVLQQELELDSSVTATIPAGIEVSSYYVAFDPATASLRDVVGTITFPGKILGLSTSVATLLASDYLGNPTATYLNPNLRGLETGDLTSFTGDTLTVEFAASTPGDYIRVFVANAPVDFDGDGLVNNSDNCILVANASQLDTNGDGFGNFCDPDLDNDGIVNFIDISLFADAFGTVGVSDADYNGDGAVNFIDFSLMPAYFGIAPGPSGLSN